MEYIEIKNAVFSYGRDDSPVVKDVTLTVKKGEFLILAGSNGSGKSTLLRLINGLLRPQSGTITFDSLDTSLDENTREIHRRAGMVFQEPENQLTSTVVEEDVAFGPENLVYSHEEMTRAVNEALEITGLTQLGKRPTTALSAGQQQRLALAGILAMSPQCLLLDEPTSMLNPRARTDLMELIHKLHREKGLTVVMATHHLDEILGSPRLIIMHKGEAVRDGKPEEILAEEGLDRWGLVPPDALKASRLIKENHPPFSLTTSEETLSRQLAAEDNKALYQLIRDFCPLFHSRSLNQAGQEPVVKIENLTHNYLKGTVLENPALTGVDFTLNRGETAVLIGNTGSGKSTLLQHINGLLLADEGEVVLLGQDKLDSSTRPNAVKRLRRSVGLVMQRPERQLFERYVGDDVAFAPRQLGLTGKNLTRRVKWAMDLAGLPFKNFKDRPIYALSGGEKRKAALAGVLALQPIILLLDEPSAGLDPLSREELHTILKELKKNGMSLVIATHDMDEAALLGDRICLMEKGRLLRDEPASSLFQRSDELQKAGLGLPFIKRVEEKL